MSIAETIIGVSASGRQVTVRLGGELDVAVLPLLRQQLLRLVDGERAMVLVLDLAEVTFVDSGALGLFIRLHRQLGELGGELRLARPRPAVGHVLESAGIPAVVAVVSTAPAPPVGFPRIP